MSLIGISLLPEEVSRGSFSEELLRELAVDRDGEMGVELFYV